MTGGLALAKMIWAYDMAVSDVATARPSGVSRQQLEAMLNLEYTGYSGPAFADVDNRLMGGTERKASTGEGYRHPAGHRHSHNTSTCATTIRKITVRG